jgi:hypothetical protein
MCVVASATVGFAQGVTTGALTGDVVDPNGEPIPGATVEVELLTTGTVYRTFTDGSGRFNLPNVKVGGPYQVTVEMPGLQSQQASNVFVSLGEKTKLDFTLQLEAARGEVVVVGQSNPLISPSKVGAASNVSLESLEALPTLERGFEDFARTNPMIVVQPDTEDSPDVISVAGRNNRYNNIQVDGAVNNDLFGLSDTGTPGGLSETTAISLDAIQELQLVIAPFDVRQGGFSGGGINAVTRSGTNDLHGSVYTYYRDDSMVGEGPSDFPEFSHYRDLNYGFRIGGPIVRDKLFFFLNGDITDRERGAGWSIDGSSGEVFAGGTLVEEAERFRNLLLAYGHDPGGPSEFIRETESDKIFARFDFNLSDNNGLTVRHNWVDADNLRLYPNEGTYAFPGDAHNMMSETNSTVFQLDSILGNNIFNQARVTYQTVRDRRSPVATFPSVSVSDVDEDSHGFRTGSGRYDAANTLDQDIIEFTDDFSWFLGDHELVFGTHNEFFSFDNLFIENAYGSYYFFNLDMLEAGIADRFYISYSTDDDPSDSFNAYQLGFYVGDKWRVTDNLSVVLGLRVDIPKFPDTPNSNPETVELFGVSTDDVPDGNELWSPRVGFNWDITGKGEQQLRGGVGVFSGRSPYVWISNNYANNGLERVYISTYGVDVPFNPDPFNQPHEIEGADVATQEVNLIDPDFEFPQITRFNLAYDRKLPWWDLVLSLEALHADSQSEILYTNLNLVETGTTLGGRPYYERLSSDYTGAYYLANTAGGYQSNVSLKLEKPYGDKFWGYVSYAWGKSRVVNEGNSSQAESNWSRIETIDPNRPHLSPSDFEVEHRINASVSYRFNRDSDWETTVSAYYNLQSGRRFSVLAYSSYPSFNGDFEQYNDLLYIPETEDEVIIQGGTWEQFMDYIHLLGLEEYIGEVIPRNAGKGPWWHTLDLSVAQSIPVGYGDLELTVTVANLMNLIDSNAGHRKFVNFGNVDPVRVVEDEQTGIPYYQLRWAITRPELDQLYYIDQLRSRWHAKIGLRWSF